MAFPVRVNKQPIDLNFVLRNEANYLFVAQNNLGAYPFIGAGTTTNSAWKSATKPTVTANSWYLGRNMLLSTYAGRKLVITALHFETTDACQIYLTHYHDQGNTLDGSISALPGVGANNNIFAAQTNASGGVVTIDFRDNPLIVSSSQRIDLYLLSTTTTGTNWNFWAEGMDITDDENYNAPHTVAVIGDSIGSLTGENRVLQYCKREDGTKTGIWGHIIQNNLLENGIDSRLVTMAIGGTNTSQWDWWVNNGKLRFAADYDILVISLGMNDCTNSTALTVTAGVDGTYKKALKNIIRTYFRRNPTGTCILNSIPATDLASRVASVATGIYAGQTRLVAYRAESAAVVSELKAQNPTWDLHLANTDTAYTTAQTTYFVETTLGTYTHPNVALGQPAYAAKIWEKVLLSNFYSRNSR